MRVNQLLSLNLARLHGSMMTNVRFVALAITFVIAQLFGYGSVTAADQPPIRILAFGDSLTAGYGLDDLNEAFPAQLERALKAKGHNVTLIPAGISGDTTTGGLNRIEWSLAEKPDAVIVALGGNDGLRAVDPAVTEKSLSGLLARIRSDGTPVLLAGMLAPPNLGRDYADRFSALFPRVAKANDAIFFPFFLDGVAGVPALNQSDRIHPNPKGVAVMVDKILPSVEKLIDQVEDRRS